ncbi:MAG: RIP metalloprotease [Rickettsiales bacterium]|jgi:regulator of sigma E protease|nr:RIP metalloprotease [Rickettsiales bacterium]
MFLTSSVAFVIIVSVVVFVHEMGHYLIARINGVRVDEFSIGMGKEVFSWKDREGTRWKICFIPCGGSCKFFGDEDMSSMIVDREKIRELSDREKSMCLQCKSPWQRIQVAVAGPLANYILALVLFTVIFRLHGVDRLSNVIGLVGPGSAAETAGIEVGDAIISVGDKKIGSFEDIRRAVLSSRGPVTVKLARNGEIIEKITNPAIQTRKNMFGRVVRAPLLGVGPSDDILVEKVGLARAFLRSLEYVARITVNNLVVLGQIVTGRSGLGEIGSPIKIAQYSGMAIRSGFYVFIRFIALISVSLGFMNLLPIPVLDGGHLLLCLTEIVRKKPLSEKFENSLTRICFSVLMALMIFFTIRDVLGIFNEK